MSPRDTNPIDGAEPNVPHPAPDQPLATDTVPVGRTRLGALDTVTKVALGAAGGMATNNVSESFGYEGLAGVTSFAAVLFAATWIRKLDPQAPLRRYAALLFLIPAAVAATIAAFGTGLWTVVPTA